MWNELFVYCSKCRRCRWRHHILRFIHTIYVLQHCRSIPGGDCQRQVWYIAGSKPGNVDWMHDLSTVRRHRYPNFFAFISTKKRNNTLKNVQPVMECNFHPLIFLRRRLFCCLRTWGIVLDRLRRARVTGNWLTYKSSGTHGRTAVKPACLCVFVCVCVCLCVCVCVCVRVWICKITLL